MLHQRFLFFVLILTAVLLVACGGDNGDDSGAIAEETLDPDTLPADPQVNVEGQMLVWIANGEFPGDQADDSPGRLLFVSGDGASKTTLRLPEGTDRVRACTDQASSPNGTYFAFYVGERDGTLYMTDGGDEVESVAENVSAMACLGMGTFQYSPDSTRLGYIDFAEDAFLDTTPAAVGTLSIRTSADREELLAQENVTGFDLSDDAAVMVGIFAEQQEVAVLQWTENIPQEISTLTASEDCEFAAADVTFANPSTAFVLTGESCSGINPINRWTLHNVNIEDRTTTRITEGETQGAYLGRARTNTVYASEDGQTIYFTFPNGDKTWIANMHAVTDAGAGEETLLVEDVSMPRFQPNTPYNLAANTEPVRSVDRNWLAVTSEAFFGDAAVHIIDLNAAEPYTISSRLPNRNDTVSAMAFTQDSGSLLFVTGGNETDDNALRAIELPNGTDRTITRGRFGTQMVVRADGNAVTLTDWQVITEPEAGSYQNLIVIDLESNEESLVLEGAELTDEIEQQRFFYPLNWR